MTYFSPPVSVIIPCYNHGRYLSEALQSLINQQYRRWEAIVINDGSTDNTQAIAEEWSKRDKRIHCFAKENGGLSSARNYGLSKAIGDYIQFLDADDIITPAKLEKSIRVLSLQNDKQSIIISNFQVLDEASGKMEPAYCNLNNIEFSFNSILTGWDESFTIPIHCAIFPALFFQKIKFDETLWAKEDWVMWLSVFKKYAPQAIFINEQLAVYRNSLNSMSNNNMSMYENTAKAFDIILNELIDNEEKNIFFKKVNDYWKKEVLYQSREIRLMNNAKYFQLQKKLLNFLSSMGIKFKK